MKNFLCPECFRTLDKHKIFYKCGSNSCSWGFDVTERGCSTDNRDRFCKACKYAKKFYGCPYCGLIVPDWYTENEAMPILLAGGTMVGKTAYLLSLMHEIKHKLPPFFNVAVDTLEDDLLNDSHYRYEYNAFWGEGNIPSAPFQIRVLFPSMTCRMSFNDTRKNINLVLYDTAGQDYCSDSSFGLGIRLYCDNFVKMKGIMLFVDPLQIPAVRKVLEGKVKLPANYQDPSEVLSRIINSVRDVKNLNPGAKIDIPIAVVFTKTDVLEKFGIIVSTDYLSLESGHIQAGCYFESEHNGVQYELISFMQTFMGYELIAQLENFKSKAFFGVSAMGSAPEGYKVKAGVNPRRVLDPLLWIFAEKGFVKKVK